MWVESTTGTLMECWVEDRDEEEGERGKEGKRHTDRSWLCKPNNRDKREKGKISEFLIFGLRYWKLIRKDRLNRKLETCILNLSRKHTL